MVFGGKSGIRFEFRTALVNQLFKIIWDHGVKKKGRRQMITAPVG
jgi:hypothetical protein